MIADSTQYKNGLYWTGYQLILALIFSVNYGQGQGVVMLRSAYFQTDQDPHLIHPFWSRSGSAYFSFKLSITFYKIH